MNLLYSCIVLFVYQTGTNDLCKTEIKKNPIFLRGVQSINLKKFVFNTLMSYCIENFWASLARDEQEKLLFDTTNRVVRFAKPMTLIN